MKTVSKHNHLPGICWPLGSTEAGDGDGDGAVSIEGSLDNGV
ncbi:MAG: hypothetical protein ABSF34_09440 [Verrucomicrobiota bacterium]